jgi:hypothetical protein
MRLPVQSAFVQEILMGYQREMELATMTKQQRELTAEMERVQNEAKAEGIVLSQRELELIRQQAEAAKNMDSVRGQIDGMTSMFKSGLSNAVKAALDGEDAGAAISNFGKQLRDKMIENMIAALVDQAVQAMIRLVMSLAGGGGGGGGLISGLLFEKGGVMTSEGAMPLRRYQRGGVARSPQLAMFGEGSVPEAYVPVPSGKIPVEMPEMNSGAPPVYNLSMNIQTNDADSFRRAQPQILADAQRKLARQGSRNN